MQDNKRSSKIESRTAELQRILVDLKDVMQGLASVVGRVEGFLKNLSSTEDDDSFLSAEEDIYQNIEPSENRTKNVQYVKIREGPTLEPAPRTMQVPARRHQPQKPTRFGKTHSSFNEAVNRRVVNAIHEEAENDTKSVHNMKNKIEVKLLRAASVDQYDIKLTNGDEPEQIRDTSVDVKSLKKIFEVENTTKKPIRKGSFRVQDDKNNTENEMSPEELEKMQRLLKYFKPSTAR